MKISLRKDEHGLAHIALVALVVVVIAAIGLVGWQVTKKKKDGSGSASTGATASKKEVQNQCQSVLDDKDLCKFAAAMSQNDLAYTATLSSSSGEGDMTIKNDGKGNSEVTSSTAGFNLDVITLNNAYYMKNTDGTWTKTDASSDLATNPSESLKYTFTAADKDLYKKIGKDSCGSLSCFKYQYTDKNAPSDETFIWFDTKDYRLQKLTYKTADGSGSMSFNYGSVKISEPSPLQ